MDVGPKTVCLLCLLLFSVLIFIFFDVVVVLFCCCRKYWSENSVSRLRSLPILKLIKSLCGSEGAWDRHTLLPFYTGSVILTSWTCKKSRWKKNKRNIHFLRLLFLIVRFLVADILYFWHEIRNLHKISDLELDCEVWIRTSRSNIYCFLKVFFLNLLMGLYAEHLIVANAFFCF